MLATIIITFCAWGYVLLTSPLVSTVPRFRVLGDQDAEWDNVPWLAKKMRQYNSTDYDFSDPVGHVNAEGNAPFFIPSVADLAVPPALYLSSDDSLFLLISYPRPGTAQCFISKLIQYQSPDTLTTDGVADIRVKYVYDVSDMVAEMAPSITCPSAVLHGASAARGAKLQIFGLSIGADTVFAATLDLDVYAIGTPLPHTLAFTEFMLMPLGPSSVLHGLTSFTRFHRLLVDQRDGQGYLWLPSCTRVAGSNCTDEEARYRQVWMAELPEGEAVIGGVFSGALTPSPEETNLSVGQTNAPTIESHVQCLTQPFVVGGRAIILFSPRKGIQCLPEEGEDEVPVTMGIVSLRTPLNPREARAFVFKVDIPAHWVFARFGGKEFPFIQMNGFLYVNLELEDGPNSPNTKLRGWHLDSVPQSPPLDVTRHRGGAYVNFDTALLGADSDHQIAVAPDILMAYYLTFRNGQPTIYHQVFLDHDGASGYAVAAVPVYISRLDWGIGNTDKPQGLWSRNTLDSVSPPWTGGLLSTVYAANNRTMYGLGYASPSGTEHSRRVLAVGGDHLFLYSFATDSEEVSLIQIPTACMWTILIATIAFAFISNRSRFTRAYKLYKDMEAVRQKVVRNPRRSTGSIELVTVTCMYCDTRMAMPRGHGELVECQGCNKVLKITLTTEAASDSECSSSSSCSSDEEASVSDNSKRVAKGVRTVRTKQKQLKTVLQSMSVVYSDKYQWLSTLCNLTNARHVLTLVFEFMQMSAFSFSPKIPWTSRGGVLQLGDFFNLSLLNIEDLNFIRGVELPHLELLNLTVFFCIVAFVGTVTWVHCSTVPSDAMKSRAPDVKRPFRCAPYLMWPFVRCLAPLTGVLFLPMLRVSFGSLSCSLISARADNVNFELSLLDSVPLVCWTGSHIWMSVLAMMSMVCFIPLSIFLYPMLQEMNALLEPKYSPTFLLLLPVAKLLLVIASNFFTAFTQVYVVIALSVNLGLALHIAFWRPCQVWSLNNWRSAGSFAAFWASLCSLVALLVSTRTLEDDVAELVPVYMLYIGWAVILLSTIVKTYVIPARLAPNKVPMKHHWDVGEATTKWEENPHAKSYDQAYYVDKVRISYQSLTRRKGVHLTPDKPATKAQKREKKQHKHADSDMDAL